ncbi:hypothetical protein ASD40_29920 [Paenibacillus sp. Root444D2]|nr:hypothetical protein ASD40_29920 [Paenibacillus sp. Root444D2]
MQIPLFFCGQCHNCKTGKGNQCTVRCEDPESMSFAEVAFIEPMACVVHAMNRLGVKAGDRAILLGAGAMGQQLIQTLVHSGVSELVVVDISTTKLELSKARGASRTIVPLF